ncbi:MAG: hypothetical protein CM15mP120_22020 [Pseudomonadota bacterium]|nr:MAG: hypothetical protein CM15mP120_22020 [Pseudomonadota bacterium]
MHALAAHLSERLGTSTSADGHKMKPKPAPATLPWGTGSSGYAGNLRKNKAHAPAIQRFSQCQHRSCIQGC